MTTTAEMMSLFFCGDGFEGYVAHFCRTVWRNFGVGFFSNFAHETSMDFFVKQTRNQTINNSTTTWTFGQTFAIFVDFQSQNSTRLRIFFQLSETFPRNNFETKTNRGARPRAFFYSQRKTAFNSVAQDFVFNLNSSATVCDIHRYFFVFVNNRRRGDRVFWSVRSAICTLWELG